MNTIRSACIALALAAGVSATAHAAPVPGTGGGYYGSAWFDSKQGAVVAGAATWADCNNQLQMYISHAISAWGWKLVTFNPCHYQPPFGEMVLEKESAGIPINAGSAGESGSVAGVLSEEIRRARAQYRVDDYEQTLRTIYEAGNGR